MFNYVSGLEFGTSREILWCNLIVNVLIGFEGRMRRLKGLLINQCTLNI